MENVYVVTWMTSEYDDINVQNEGVYLNKKDAMKKVNEIIEDVTSDLVEGDDYDRDKWTNDYDNSTHYIISTYDERWDEVIISTQTLKENK